MNDGLTNYSVLFQILFVVNIITKNKQINEK